VITSFSRDFLRKINDLANVMRGVRRHAQEHSEARIRTGLSRVGIRLEESIRGLRANRRGNHIDGTIKIREDLFLRRLGRVRELQRAIANVPAPGNARANVVIEIAC